MKGFLILGACWCLLLGACGETATPRAGSQTHWLSACQGDVDCGDDLVCRCGYCVALCTGDASCDAPVAGAECFAADSIATTDLCEGDSAPEPLCLVACASDTQCPAGRCVGGACLPEPQAGGTGGTGGTGGIGGTGASGGLCGMVVCGPGESCCGPSECGRCVPTMSGQYCPDDCPTGGSGGAGDTCYVLPDLDRSCASANDCFIGLHMVDCCGNAQAVSFNTTERDSFSAYERPCSTPACTCPGGLLQSQEGAAIQQITDATAECVDGQCLARAPENAGTCLENDVCISVEQEGACIDASGPVGAGICRGAAGLCTYCECAAPNTPIATPSGERPIAELEVGDLVYSVEDEATIVVPIARVNRRRVEAHRVMEVHLESGVVLQVSPGHPTADGRTFADLLGGGQLDGQRILAAHMIAYPYPYTHDILPASSTGTYFAGGALIGSTLR